MDVLHHFTLGSVDNCSISPSTPTFRGMSAESTDPADTPRGVGIELTCQQNLNEWLQHLETRHHQEIQLGLKRVREVAARLQLLPLAPPVITVAGTNGKGSTVAALEAVYRAAGYRVGVYTSPHLFRFNERIVINQHAISDDDLCNLFCHIESVRQEIPLTYFEMTTLASLIYFKQNELDVIILEVGMGGRRDATNIVDPNLAIITTIDLDHQAYLGSTREAIAYEKAGILRPNKPMIYADTASPFTLTEQVRLLNVDSYLLEKDYTFFANDDGISIIIKPHGTMELNSLHINPKAAAAAAMACTLLQALLPVEEKHIKQGLSNAFVPGRQQIVKGHVTTLFDVGHNPQAIYALAQKIKNMRGRLDDSQKKECRVHAIFGALKDKDLCGLIKPMCEWVDLWYPTLLKGNRAPSELLLMEAFNGLDCRFSTQSHSNDPLDTHSKCFQDPYSAYCAAFDQSNANDIIVVYGSFLTVGPVLSTIGITNDDQQRGYAREIV